MAKKQTRLNELNDAGIDYSMPINRFAGKAKALLNRLGREMKESGRSNSAEYGDGSARVYLSQPISTKLLAKFDKEVRKIAAKHEVGKAPLSLPIVDITVRNYEIDIAFC